MTLAELKVYLEQMRGGVAAVPQIGAIVDRAIETAYGHVWGAHQWKIKRREDTSRTTTSGQAHTVLPDDMEALINVVVENGTNSRWINIMTEENFDNEYPRPASYNNSIPLFAKLVRMSNQQGNVWRLYWFPVPDGAYTLRIVRDVKANVGDLPNLPSYMLSAVVDWALTFVMPPGNERALQQQNAEATLRRAIKSDGSVSGSPSIVGTDPEWNAGAFVGNNSEYDPELPSWP